MAVGAILPLALFVVIAGSVGFRLTRLWRRTRAVPEGCLGIGLLLVTASMPLAAAGRVPGLALQPIGRLCFGAGVIAAGLGVFGIVYFNRAVFRRDARWAGGLAFAAGGLLMASALYMAVANFTGDDMLSIKRAMHPGAASLMGTVLGCFAWASVESFRCHASARRRLALGLSDRLAVNRFLLWGLANLACSALLTVLTACVLAGMVILREPLPLSTIAACGVVMSTCWTLTFLTPERYRRFVLGEPSRQSENPTSSSQLE